MRPGSRPASGPSEQLPIEAIRLRPLVPFVAIETVADSDTVGVAVTARTKIVTLARPAMPDPARLADPCAFRPFRRANEASQGGVRHRACLPCEAGARVCPGRALATAGMRPVPAMLLGRFRPELACEPAAIAEVNAPIMEPGCTRLRPIAR